MLSIILFLGFWIVLALGLLFIAIRGGLSGARETLQTQSRGGRKAVWVIFAIVYLGVGFALPLAMLTGNHSKASAQVGGQKLTAAEKRGRELFGEHCAVCHTLAAATAVGKVGPNLDTLQLPESLILHTITNGCLQNPPSSDPTTCLGYGTMPANLVQGRDATDVAQFIQRVAGKE